MEKGPVLTHEVPHNRLHVCVGPKMNDSIVLVLLEGCSFFRAYLRANCSWYQIKSTFHICRNKSTPVLTKFFHILHNMFLGWDSGLAQSYCGSKMTITWSRLFFSLPAMTYSWSWPKVSRSHRGLHVSMLHSLLGISFTLLVFHLVEIICFNGISFILFRNFSLVVQLHTVRALRFSCPWPFWSLSIWLHQLM